MAPIVEAPQLGPLERTKKGGFRQGPRGPKKDQISRTRADSCERQEGPLFRGKLRGAPFSRAGRFSAYTASIAAAPKRSNPPL